MKKILTFFLGISTVSCFLLSSCKTLSYRDLPAIPVTYNFYEYTIQNLDDAGKCDVSTLTAHYDGFDINYHLDEHNVMTLTIENHSNKSLILDKAKCFVLYNGYSKDLFKDVRTGKVTTYNNVQDAISSVNTNESSVTMSIPPYSKWQLPVSETNLRSCSSVMMNWEVGNHPFTNFTTNETIEFILPYTFDYSLAKWGTCRNRVYIGNIRVENRFMTVEPTFSDSGYCYRAQVSPNADLSNYYSTIRYNEEVAKKESKRGSANFTLTLLGIMLSPGVIAGIIAIIL